MMNLFDPTDLHRLFYPHAKSSGEDNGQLTIIGGSHLFHGAPLFGVKIASRMVDMVFFASPDQSVGKVAERIKSKLLSFIWVPIDEVDNYIAKSDAVLIGPGLMRFKSERAGHGERTHICDEACQITRSLTQRLLTSFPDKKWVIDAGSLQTMVVDWIPKGAILTPNKKEYAMLFGEADPHEVAKQYDCTLVLKGPQTLVVSAHKTVAVNGGNPGLTKGGTGDVQSGLTAALLTKNDPFLAASCAAFIVKAAADELYKTVGVNYNADDLANIIPSVVYDRMNAQI